MVRFLHSRARKFVLFAFDAVSYLALAVFVLLLTQAATRPHFDYPLHSYFMNMALLCVVTMVSRLLFGVYRNVWRYTSTVAYFKLLLADALGGFVACMISYGYAAFGDTRFQIGFWFYVILVMAEAHMTLYSRYIYRLLYKYFNKKELEETLRIPVAIVGAGQHGAMLAGELSVGGNSHYKPMFFIDSDESKIGSLVADLPVYREDMTIFEKIAEAGVEELFFAFTDLSSEDAKRMYHFYSTTNCKLRIFDLSERDGDDTAEWASLFAFKTLPRV